MGFIKALLIILLIWYSIKLLARILIPIFIAKFIRNTQERFQQKYQGQQNKKDCFTREHCTQALHASMRTMYVNLCEADVTRATASRPANTTMYQWRKIAGVDPIGRSCLPSPPFDPSLFSCTPLHRDSTALTTRP